MRGLPLSDDQITYWATAEAVRTMPFFSVLWNPTHLFSYCLAWIFRFTGDPSASFLVLYALTVFLYLRAMVWCLSYFFKDKKLCFCLALVSIVPHYTLAMTYWGFAGFEFIKGRILLMPLLPVIFRRYYEWKEDRKIWRPLALCGLGTILSYEAAYLLGILALDSAWNFWREKERRSLLPSFFKGVFLALALVFLVRYSQDYLQSYFGIHWFDNTAEIYEKLVPANRETILAMSGPEYADLHWRSAYRGFWWTLFPPRWMDLAFAAFNAFFLLLFGFLGARRQKKENPALFAWNVRLLIGVVLVSYSLQALLFVGWKTMGWHPSIWEEVRAFKFAFFPLFLFIGSYLVFQLKENRAARFYAAILLLLLSPLEILQSLPPETKARSLETMTRVLKNPVYAEYAAKALNVKDAAVEKDISRIRLFLKLRKDRNLFALTDLHALKEEGVHTIISYQDKRIHDFRAGPRQDRLPYWGLAYEEVQGALRSGDAARVLRTADKYECAWVVSPHPLAHERLESKYAGSVYHLYRVRKP